MQALVKDCLVKCGCPGQPERLLEAAAAAGQGRLVKKWLCCNGTLTVWPGVSQAGTELALELLAL